MDPLAWTAEQRRAVETVGGDVVVSAAAGAGKTSVLAERCAYLVCDAPAPYRCDVEQLLVLTFTEAAAEEMRSRIVDRLRERTESIPENARLARQVALIDSAHVSTIHAFCLWMIRRWFHRLGLDPTASVMDADEAVLLQREVIDELFEQLYKAGQGDGPELGGPGDVVDEPESRPGADGAPSDLAMSFLRLVEHYGLGNHGAIADFVLQLHQFIRSLPDPDGWLTNAAGQTASDHGLLLQRWVEALKEELSDQIEWIRARLGIISDAFLSKALSDYAAQLEDWRDRLGGSKTLKAELNVLSTAHDAVCAQIAQYKFPDYAAPRRGRSRAADEPKPESPRPDAGRGLRNAIRESLFVRRLRTPFSGPTAARRLQDLEQVAPHVRTLVELVRRFDASMTRAKRNLNVLDFSDLEQFAHRLLAGTPPRSGSASDDSEWGWAEVESETGSTAGPVPRNQVEEDDDDSAVAWLRRRFVHVLVDEFQDINPIQEEIIRLVSREPDAAADNLFLVGDLKQSIYRFRLAEPSLMARRLADRKRQTVLSLRTNFRSRPPILEAVNSLFRALMIPGTGDIPYGPDDEMHAARGNEPSVVPEPVEIHVMPIVRPSADPEGDRDDETRRRPRDDPSRWSAMEREAYLIGSLIEEYRRAGRLPGGPPFLHGSIAVLMRALKVNGGQVVDVLGSLGVPAVCGAGGSLLAAREIRDVVAVLRLIDNARQDIPMAAVLRSGVLGESLSDEELAAVRCLESTIPFHECVTAYAERGPRGVTRERIRRLLDQLDRTRHDFRVRPLPDALWRMYEDHGFLAVVGGLPAGRLRRANLIKLHDLARRFSTFRRQGVHRFLRFLDALDEEDRAVAAGTSVDGDSDAVRVMSIHQSKGLEFPVVFVAGLGNRFNLCDRRGRMIFERTTGIGLCAVDRERWIDFPTINHRLVAREVDRRTREEEMRILYVAMTRARDKLVLVATGDPGREVDGTGHRPEDGGSGLDGVSISSEVGVDDGEEQEGQNHIADAPRWVQDPRTSGTAAPTRLAVLGAASPWDWIHSVLGKGLAGSERKGKPPRRPGPPNERDGRRGLELHIHEVEEIQRWRLQPTVRRSDRRVRSAVSRLAPLPESEPKAAPDHGALVALRTRLNYHYPRLSVSSVPAVVAASALKRRFDDLLDPESPPGTIGIKRGPDRTGSWSTPAVTGADRPSKAGVVPKRSRNGDTEGPDAARRIQTGWTQDGSVNAESVHRGIAMHRVLQHLDFARTRDPSDLPGQLDGLMDRGIMTLEERGLLDVDGLSWFVQTDLAEEIREAGDGYLREFAFVSLIPIHELDPTLSAFPDEHALVRGIIDGMLKAPERIEIIDFKTDAIDEAQLDGRAAFYGPQMRAYAEAMRSLWGRREAACRLVFLAPHRIVSWAPFSRSTEPRSRP